MVLPVSVVLLSLLLLYSGSHNISVTDSLRQLLGRAPKGHLGSLSGAPTVTADNSGGSSSDTGSGTLGDGSRAAIIAAAKSALSYHPGYSQARPMPGNLTDCALTPTDCSGFATLVYKAAGAPDPNGLAYNGEGFTGTMEHNGKATQNPQPGDLMFWQSPDHVAIYGGGDVIYEWGGPPGPIQSSASGEMSYHARYLGARTYIKDLTPIQKATQSRLALRNRQ